MDTSNTQTPTWYILAATVAFSSLWIAFKLFATPAPRAVEPTPTTTTTTTSSDKSNMAAPASVMSAPRTDLAPPKNDPFTLADLKQYDGSDPSKPIYLAIKGTVFDVSNKKEMYGPGAGYSIFAGKDASKGLGSSSLKPEDAVPDWSGLDDKAKGVLNDWYTFFTKRYNIVGRVTDLPESVRNL